MQRSAKELERRLAILEGSGPAAKVLQLASAAWAASPALTATEAFDLALQFWDELQALKIATAEALRSTSGE